MKEEIQRRSAASAVYRAAATCGLSACVGGTKVSPVKPRGAGFATGPSPCYTAAGHEANAPASIAHQRSLVVHEEHQRRQWCAPDPDRDSASDQARLNMDEAKDQMPWDKPEAEPEAEAETHVIEVQTLQKQLGEAARQTAEAQTKCSLLEQKFRDEHCVLQQHLAEREVELMSEVARANSQAAKRAEEASAKAVENAKLLEEVRELREETQKLRMQRHESKLQAAAKLREASRRLDAAQEETRLVKQEEETLKQELLALREQVIGPSNGSRTLQHELAQASVASSNEEDRDGPSWIWGRPPTSSREGSIQAASEPLTPLGRAAVQPGVELSPLWRGPSPVPDGVPDEHDATDMLEDAEVQTLPPPEDEEVCASRPVPSSAPVRTMAPSNSLTARSVPSIPSIRGSPTPLLARAIPVSSTARASFTNRMAPVASPETWQFREFRERSAPLAIASASTLASPEAAQTYRELTAPLPHREGSTKALPAALPFGSLTVPSPGAMPRTGRRSTMAGSSASMERIFKVPSLSGMLPTSGSGSFAVTARPYTSSPPSTMGSARYLTSGGKMSIPSPTCGKTSIPSPPSSVRTPGALRLPVPADMPGPVSSRKPIVA